MERIKDVVVHSWLRWMIFSLAPAVSNVESWGILRRNALRTRKQPQTPRLSSVAWFTSILAMSILETGFVLIAAVTILVLVLFEAIVLVFLETILLVFLEMILVFVTLETNPVLMMTLETNPLCTLILETVGVLKLIFDEMMKMFLDVRKDDVTFLDVQTDGVTLPVPCSSSSFSLGSVVVVGPRENVCSDMKFESDGGTDDSKPEPLAKSAEMKRLVGIAVASGTPIRVAYKDVRRRMRIEARRQKELDEGVEPEVVLDSFLDQVKVEQQQQSGPLKRVLTPSAKAAKHRRARDKKLRETLCWWIANDKVCPHGDRCNFRHTVSETGALLPNPAPEQTMCETGVSWPSLATEQDKSETGVSSPGPSTNPTHPRSPTRDSWNNSWDRYDYRDKWTDVWKDGHDGNRWIHGWNEHYHGDN